jgi:peptidoglycan hydrolase-like protein with peptidoglycan-binding domain
MIRFAAALALATAVGSLPVAAQPAPAALGAADVMAAMTAADRMALQSDLAWAGHYNGAIDGEIGSRTIAAIKAFQKSRRGKDTGVLNPQERDDLRAAARKLQHAVGWTQFVDPATGIHLGLPLKRTPRKIADAGLTTWNSPQDTIQIRLVNRRAPGATTAMLAEREKQTPVGRTITYAMVKPDAFVLSGTQGLKKFYMRGALKDDQFRALTILYDQATEGTMEPVVIAMSSAFVPFPAGGPVARPPVEYATGIMVDANGTILTTAEAVAGCTSIVVGGLGNADRIAEDKAANLALLRVYGMRGLTALPLGGDARSGAVEVIGIADPQLQNGAAAVSLLKANASRDGGGFTLSPAPAAGFSGAAALSGGAFAGVASGAALIGAGTVRTFLKVHGVTATDSAGEPRAAIVRVICVRK